MPQNSTFREEVAWAAGLFEGEGCVAFGQSGRKGSGKSISAQIRLAMTDRDMVERFAQVVRVGALHRPRRGRPNEKIIYGWAAYGFENVQQVIAMFWPWLGQRRRARAREVLLATRQTQARGKRPLCPQGHAYEGANLVRERISRNGRAYLRRRCATCRKQQARDRARARRQQGV
jgi:hypothetical protein